MKNWHPFVPGPAFAMARAKGVCCTGTGNGVVRRKGETRGNTDLDAQVLVVEVAAMKRDASAS